MLEYAQRPPWHRRRRWQFVVLAAIIVFIATLALWDRGAFVKRANLTLAQRRVPDVAFKPGIVVFEEDPAKAAELVKSDVRYARGNGRLKGSAILTPPGSFLSYPDHRLGRYYSDEATLFFGRLTDDNNNRVIVWVWAGLGMTPGDQVELELRYYCDPVLPLTGRPAVPMSGVQLVGSILDGRDVPFERLGLHRNLTLMSGQPDPRAPQELKVRYAIDGTPGTIRFHLVSNGYMLIRVVDGPLTYDHAHAWAQRMRKEHEAVLKPATMRTD